MTNNERARQPAYFTPRFLNNFNGEEKYLRTERKREKRKERGEKNAREKRERQK